MKPLIFAVLSVFAVQSTDLLACTTFCMNNGTQVIFGRNYDWDVGIGLLMINKRNVSKTAMFPATYRPAKWTSKYGSLTFNQYGREFPTGGINETGLVVELMMLQESVYPPADRRPVVGCLEWIQYQLDNSRRIADVLKHSRAIRISSTVKLHYLVCERSGACVTAEFLNGQFVPHYGAALPVASLTNDTYDKSLTYLRTLSGFGGNVTPSGGSGSLERFARAAIMMNSAQAASPKNLVNYGFNILSSVAQADYTKWNIVYDLTHLKVYFRTSTSRAIKHLDLSKLSYACSTTVQVMNINAVKRGDAFKRLRKYTTAINRKLVHDSYKATPFLTGVSDQEIESVAQHPETFACTE